MSLVETEENSKAVPVILSHPQFPKAMLKPLSMSITEHSPGARHPLLPSSGEKRNPSGLKAADLETEEKLGATFRMLSVLASQWGKEVEGSRRCGGRGGCGEWLGCCFYTIKEDHCNWGPLNHNTSAHGSLQLQGHLVK